MRPPGETVTTTTAPRPDGFDEPAPTVLVVGSGGIGSFYGAVLHRAGVRVSMVCRSDFETVSAQGVRVDSPLGDLSFRPERVLREAGQWCANGAPPPDFIVLCVKVLDGLDRAALIRPAVGPRTAIVLIENGIDIERELAEAFACNPLVSVLAFVGVSRVAPGHVKHQAYGHLTAGCWPRGVDDAARRFARWIGRGGIETTLSEDIVTERWRKTMWNAAFNPLSVLAGGADTALLLSTQEGEALVRALMHEVRAAAAASGHALPAQQVDDYIASTKRMPPYRNSMALDLLAGRPVELEAILGNLVRAARSNGAAVPRLETIYVAVRQLMADLAQRRTHGGAGIVSHP